MASKPKLSRMRLVVIATALLLLAYVPLPFVLTRDSAECVKDGPSSADWTCFTTKLPLIHPPWSPLPRP